MRIGSLVYATESGLGILARSFHRAGVVTDVLVVRHGRHVTHDDWYPDAAQLADLRRPVSLTMARAFCRQMDAMLFFETPFLWDLLPWCREIGVPTALMPMHECSLERPPAEPDLYLCPSLLEQQCYPSRSRYLPVPVSVPWRERTRARVYVHHAGHWGLRGRNGTRELVEAMLYVRSPIELILRSQAPVPADVRERIMGAPPHVRVRVEVGTVPYDRLWDEGDVFVFPERFNGLSLPLQEARAAGMLVMGTARWPMTSWLPEGPLIPASGTRRARVGPPYREYDEAMVEPEAIAATMDEWYDRDISAHSRGGREWAARMSWTVLGPQYREAMESLCASHT